MDFTRTPAAVYIPAERHPGRERLKLWVHHPIGQASGQQHGKTVMVGEQGGVGWWLEAAAMPVEVALGHRPPW